MVEVGDIGLDKWISKMEEHRRKKHRVVIGVVDYREDHAREPVKAAEA